MWCHPLEHGRLTRGPHPCGKLPHSTNGLQVLVTPQLGVRPCKPSLYILCSNVDWVIMFRSCAGDHGCCDFVNAVVLLCPDCLAPVLHDFRLLPPITLTLAARMTSLTRSPSSAEDKTNHLKLTRKSSPWSLLTTCFQLIFKGDYHHQTAK